jgi:tetratricopeptide (TPR) repeat protein
MNKFLLSVLVILNSLIGFSQKSEMEIRKMARESSESDLVNESSTLMNLNQLYLAEILVDKLIQFSPDNSNYNYKKGFILLYAKNDFKGAIPFLKKATEKTNLNYDVYSSNEKSSSIDAYYHLGVCYHLNEQFELAKQSFNQFLFSTDSKSELILKAHSSILQCNVAIELIKKPKNAKVNNMGKVINSVYSDYSPVVSLDGSAIYFTSRRPWEDGASDQYRDNFNKDYPEDIYVSYLDDKIWSSPKRIEFCDPERNEATIAVSSDEKRIYVYQDNKGGGDIYFSEFNTNYFKEIQSLDYKGLNSENWETHCTMTPDGLNMYFVSDRPGGIGGRDIYRIVKLPNGEWSLPQNLGPSINTVNDEDAPFIGVDNKTLYFSSNGPKSMGGFDVFVSIRDENNNWGDPINMGFPINSVADDIFYTTTIDGLKGYLSSSRNNGFGEKDIYEIENDYFGRNNIATLKGQIKVINNAKLPSDLRVDIRCLNCESSIETSTTPRLRDGTFFSALLEHCREYEYVLVQEKTNIELYKESFSTSCDNLYNETYREIVLDTENMKVISTKDVSILNEDNVTADLRNKKEKELDLKASGVHEVNNNIKSNLTKDFEMIHYFDYNLNKLSVKSGDLKLFLDNIEHEIKTNQRNSFTIQIQSSASKVPTKAYSSNELLAQLRAENIKKELLLYIANNKNIAKKVTVEIVSSIVDGPEYLNDASNSKKYQKFQFVSLKTK